MLSSLCCSVISFYLISNISKHVFSYIRSVLPDITASSVAVSTLRAVKLNAVTLTAPSYLFFIMYIVRSVLYSPYTTNYELKISSIRHLSQLSGGLKPRSYQFSIAPFTVTLTASFELLFITPVFSFYRYNKQLAQDQF